jgi:glycyl-tRNA synthetase beta chain
MPALLLEIGLEEVPAGMVTAGQMELAQRVEALLVRERLLFENYELRSCSTPRRLAVMVEGVLARQSDAVEEMVGPSIKVAYRDGAPTPAALAFAKKSGVEVSALKTVQNAKGEYVSATVQRAGRSAAEVLSSSLPAELNGLSWPKTMYWRPGRPERFVRPVRWLLALLDEEVLPLEFAGIAAGGVSYGHRVLQGEGPVVVRAPHEYAEKLTAAYVQVDPEARRHRIRKALDAATRQIPGARWREDEALVDVATYLTEWPSVILGSFDPAYLDLPEEVLVTVMRDHQKYFALEDGAGKLLPNFLAVLNIAVDESGAATIRHGNERVLRARFNDARFFWDVDQKVPLIDRVEMLKTVTFQKDLGSYWDKTQANLRVVRALVEIAQGNAQGFGNGGPLLDEAALIAATRLAKADLTTELVKEFTELQGQVGGLYARAQGLGEVTASAIYDQYLPASIEGAIPRTLEGVLFGLADRMHTIAAMFNIGLEPSGSKDPFALRRAGNAVVKMMTKSTVSGLIKIPDLIGSAVNSLERPDPQLSEKVQSFLRERAQYYLEVGEGVPSDCVQAAMAVQADDLHNVLERARAVRQAKSSSDFLAISSSFKRISKILHQAATAGDSVPTRTEPSLFASAEETNLLRHTIAWSGTSDISQSYVEALMNAARLRPHVDAFFDKVMVMVPEADIRRNRLALLQFVLGNFSRIADFSQIVVDENISV